jgi:hypothetical protein
MKQPGYNSNQKAIGRKPIAPHRHSGIEPFDSDLLIPRPRNLSIRPSGHPSIHPPAARRSAGQNIDYFLGNKPLSHLIPVDLTTKNFHNSPPFPPSAFRVPRFLPTCSPAMSASLCQPVRPGYAFPIWPPTSGLRIPFFAPTTCSARAQSRQSQPVLGGIRRPLSTINYRNHTRPLRSFPAIATKIRCICPEHSSFICEISCYILHAFVIKK